MVERTDGKLEARSDLSARISPENMKIGRYVLVALTVVIVAFVIQRLCRLSPAEVTPAADSMESPTTQVPKSAANPLSPPKQPSVATETTTAKNPSASNAPISEVSIVTEKQLPAEIISTSEAQPAEPAAPPPSALSIFSKGPPPPTPVAPPPAELFRTNTPEKPPHEGGASPRP
jgi:hypothetical protein